MNRLTPDELEAIAQLLARATRANCLPAPEQVMTVVDLLWGELPAREKADGVLLWRES
jgi:hypothetical protein